MPSLPVACRVCSWVGLALAAWLLAARPAQGDAGPPPFRPSNPTRIEIEVRPGKDGLPSGTWQAALLVPSSCILDKDDSGCDHLPGLPEPVTTWLDSQGGSERWRLADTTLLTPDEGTVRRSFPWRRSGRPNRERVSFPPEVRLLVYHPAAGKVYVTDPAATRTANANFFVATLGEDGGGALELVPMYSPQVLLPLGGPFLVILGLTLAAELAIAALWVALFRPGGSRPFLRVLPTTLAANLLSVPALFLLGAVTKMYVPEQELAVYLAVLFGGLALAIIGEGVLYALWGRLPLQHAALLSTMANLSTILFCCFGVWAVGW